jgi:hypothetical protein
MSLLPSEALRFLIIPCDVRRYLRALKKKEVEASADTDSTADEGQAAEGDRKRSGEELKVSAAILFRFLANNVALLILRLCLHLSDALPPSPRAVCDKQGQPSSKRQRVKEKEKRRKDRLALGKDKLCFAIAEGRSCPHGVRFHTSYRMLIDVSWRKRVW